jgi:hypothetical protein
MADELQKLANECLSAAKSSVAANPHLALCEMLAEKRRLEALAIAADNAVLRQSLAIWERYQVYVTARSIINVEPPGNIPEAIISTLNREPMSASYLYRAILGQWPHIKMNKVSLYNSLTKLVQDGMVEREKVNGENEKGPRMAYGYRKPI